MKKACIFDLDGTLLYTLPSMARPGNRVLQELGFAPLPVQNYRLYCGEGSKMLVTRILAASGDEGASLFEKAYPLYAKYFGEDPLYQVEPFPGIARMLDALKGQGIRLGVCSNKPHAATKAVIEGKFPGVFDVIIGQSEELRRKPYPDMPLKVASCLEADPADCLYIGDSGTDMKTGRAAGMDTVGVLWGYRDREELAPEADYLITDPGQIEGILLGKDLFKIDKPTCKNGH